MFIVRIAATGRPPKEVDVYSQDRRDRPTSEGGPCFIEIRISAITTQPPWEGLSTQKDTEGHKLRRISSTVTDTRV
jgi:hypothetical protein